MYGKMKDHLVKELAQIRDSGLYKDERVLAGRQGARVQLADGRQVTPRELELEETGTEPLPLKDVVGRRKVVPLDHCWLESARNVGTCLGD